MQVNRCVCQSISFDRLKTIAAEDNADFEQLKARTGCGAGCGLCAPYVRLMLATGTTTFPPMTSETLAAELANAIATAHPPPTG